MSLARGRGKDAAASLTERLSSAERDRSHPRVPVRDAASLIIYDDDGPSVLMGRRNHRHVFMPNRFVFPGGRVDPADGRVKVAGEFAEPIDRKLAAQTRARHGAARSRALGVAALRETFEETGVIVGASPSPAPADGASLPAFTARGLAVDLSGLAFVARAITPPGRPRRYDTRFFMIRREAIADVDEAAVGEDAELEEIAWVPIKEARTMRLPTITLTVLDELTTRLAADPALSPDGPVPYYHWRGKGFLRQVL